MTAAAHPGRPILTAMRKLLFALAVGALAPAPIGARVKAAPGQAQDCLVACFALTDILKQFPPKKK